MAFTELSKSTVSDICSHLHNINLWTIAAEPRTIVELGVRQGESSRPLFLASQDTQQAVVHGFDLDNCRCIYELRQQEYPRAQWTFHQEHSVQAASRFADGSVDVLFLDTSHLRHDTQAEFKAWWPKLAARCVFLLHDTNLRQIYQRRNGSTGVGWDNHRGVISVVQDQLGLVFDEQQPFRGVARSRWHVWHDPISNGLTALYRGLAEPNNLEK